jgi:Tfp pilus assembly protein PilO
VSRTFRILIVAVVAVVAVGGYWKLVLSPKRAQVTALETKVGVEQAKLAQTQSTLADYTNAKQAYKTNYATLVGLGKAVPGDDDVRSLVVQLDAAAKRSGVGFENIDVSTLAPSSTSNVATTSPSTGSTPPGAVSAGAFSVLPFNFSFTGDFTTLSKFLARLDRFVTLDGDRIAVNGRLLHIDNLQLVPGADGWPSMSAQIGASSYVVPDPRAVPAADGTTAADGTATAASAAATPAGADGAPPASTTASTSTTSASSGDLR